MPEASTNHYTVNKAVLLFQPEGGSGWEDLGNGPKAEVSEEVELLEHFSSRSGLKLRDQVVNNSLKAMAAISLDEMTIENLKKYFFGNDITSTAQAAATGEEKIFLAADKITKDRWFDIGAINITVSQVDDNGGTPVIYSEGTDYELNRKKGMIYIKSGGGIANDSELKITYDQPDATIKDFLAGVNANLRGFFRIVGDPGFGEVTDIEGYGLLSPEGAYTAVTDEYTTVDMKLEFITHPNYSPGLFKVENRGNVTVTS